MDELELIFNRVRQYYDWSDLDILDWLETPNRHFNFMPPYSFWERNLGYKVLKYIEDCIENKKDL